MSTPPFQQDYFTLFGLPPQYAIDLAALTARYHELQRTAHPDRFAGAADQERRLSAQYAAWICITAYRQR